MVGEKLRGRGSANVGVPQLSPLSPVVFFIWMAPIFRKMEERVKEETGLDVEISSFGDDRCADVIDSDGSRNMQRVEVEVKRIVHEVAEESNMPIKLDKEEVLHS